MRKAIALAVVAFIGATAISPRPASAQGVIDPTAAQMVAVDAALLAACVYVGYLNVLTIKGKYAKYKLGKIAKNIRQLRRDLEDIHQGRVTV